MDSHRANGLVRWYNFGLFDIVRALGRPVMMYDVMDWDRDYSFNPANKAVRAWERAQAEPPQKSNYRGITYDRWSKKWKAQIRWNGKRISLGKFPDETTAHERYERERAKLEDKLCKSTC